MKKSFLSILVMLATSVFLNVYPQVTPPGAGDKDLRDNNIRMRSVEIERVKREAAKGNSPLFLLINSDIESKYPQIKEDFESIQISQTAIIKAYTTGEKIDYTIIESSAEVINRNAKRLDSNLFASKMEKKENKSKQKEAINIKNLIVELDNAIGSFVSSKMFLDLKVIDPETAKKTRVDLASIMELADKLSKEAKVKKKTAV